MLDQVLVLAKDDGLRIALHAAQYVEIESFLAITPTTFQFLRYQLKNKAGKIEEAQLSPVYESTIESLRHFAVYKESENGRPFTATDWLTVSEDEFDDFQGSSFNLYYFNPGNDDASAEEPSMGSNLRTIVYPDSNMGSNYHDGVDHPDTSFEVGHDHDLVADIPEVQKNNAVDDPDIHPPDTPEEEDQVEVLATPEVLEDGVNDLDTFEIEDLLVEVTTPEVEGLAPEEDLDFPPAPHLMMSMQNMAMMSPSHAYGELQQNTTKSLVKLPCLVNTEDPTHYEEKLSESFSMNHGHYGGQDDKGMRVIQPPASHCMVHGEDVLHKHQAT